MMEGDDIDFSGIDEDLEQFQQDDIVRQALLQGVDLRGYARDIDLELREVRVILSESIHCACDEPTIEPYLQQSTIIVVSRSESNGCTIQPPSCTLVELPIGDDYSYEY